MGFPEQLTQMKREYRKQAVKLDDKFEQPANRMDDGLGAVQECLSSAENRLGEAENAIHFVQRQLHVAGNEVTATSEAMAQIRADLRETARSMSRSRLMEASFGTMLEAVGASIKRASGDSKPA